MRRDRSFEVHFGWGLALAACAGLFGAPAWVAFVGATAAGLAVELVQAAWPRAGSATVEDFIYTGLGGLVGGVLVALS